MQYDHLFKDVAGVLVDKCVNPGECAKFISMYDCLFMSFVANLQAKLHQALQRAACVRSILKACRL